MPEKVEMMVDIDFLLAAADHRGRGRRKVLQVAPRMNGVQTFAAASTSARRTRPAFESLPQTCRSWRPGCRLMDPVRMNISHSPVRLSRFSRFCGLVCSREATPLSGVSYVSGLILKG